MNSYIHELLIYLRLQGFISGFETSLWLYQVASGNTNCACAYLHQIQSGFVSSSNSILDSLLDGDVFFRSCS